MKKPIKPRKLSFVPTTVRNLRPEDLANVVGGNSLSCNLKISVGLCD